MKGIALRGVKRNYVTDSLLLNGGTEETEDRTI
jgi:hypothetical protein